MDVQAGKVRALLNFNHAWPSNVVYCIFYLLFTHVCMYNQNKNERAKTVHAMHMKYIILQDSSKHFFKYMGICMYIGS
jgi:hypothetical protein